MAKFPIQRSERTISGQAPAVRANYDTSTGEAQLWNTIGDSTMKISQTLMAIEQKKRDAIDLKSEMAIRNDFHQALAEFETIKETTPPEEWDKKYDEIVGKAKSRASNYDMSQDKSDYLLTSIYGSGNGEIFGEVDVIRAREQGNAIKQINKDNQTVADYSLYQAHVSGNEDEIKAAESAYDRAYNDVNKEVANVGKQKILLKANIQNVQNQVAVQKQLFANGKIPNLDTAREIVQSSTIIPEEEKQAALQNITSYEEYQKNKNNKRTEENKQKTIDSFVEQFISTGNVSPDDVLNSNLDLKTSRDEMGDKNISQETILEWIKGSYEPVTESNFEGSKELNNALIGYLRGTNSKKETIRLLGDLRYVDKSITQEDFTSTIKRMENPEFKKIVVDIETALSDNEKAGYKMGGWGKTNWEERNIQRANSELLNWVDNQLSAGKTPTGKEIYQKSKELLAGEKTKNGDGDVFDVKSKKSASPYKDYPDAFNKDGKWYVIRDGKRYRIQD